MHASVQRILESHGIPDQTLYPTGMYALKAYQKLVDELFPHLTSPGEAKSTLGDDMLAFAKLRRILLPLGIRLIVSDIKSPDPGRLSDHLDKIGAYSDFRDEQLQDPDSLANECARSLVKLKNISDAQQSLEKEYQALESRLSKDRAEYTTLQQENRENIKYVKDKYAECKELSARASQKTKVLEEKNKEMARVSAAIDTNRGAIETLQPYVDEKTGQVKSAKSEIQNLERELQSTKAQMKELAQSTSQLEEACTTLDSIKEQLPALHDTLKNYKQQTEILEVAKREQSALRTEFERERRHLTTLQDTIQNLECQLEQLQEQESKVRQELDHTTEEWNQAIATLDAEENNLIEEIGTLCESTETLKQKLTGQREYGHELETLLQTAPRKLKSVEEELDLVLNEIAIIKLSPPKCSAETPD